MILKDILNLVNKDKRKRERMKVAQKIAIDATELSVAAAAGPATGILFAPKSGKETREDLKTKAVDAVETIKDTVEKSIETMKDSAAQATKEVLVKQIKLEQQKIIKTQQETIDKQQQNIIKIQQDVIDQQKDIKTQQDIIDKQKEIATPQPATPKPATPKPSVKIPKPTTTPKKAMTANQAIALVLKNKFQNRIEFDAVSWGINMDKGVKCYQIKVTNMEIAKDGGTGSEGIFAVDIYTGKIWEWESITYN